MTNEEYETTQQRLALLGEFTRDLDLAGFISKAETALAMGPIVDPTAWRKAVSRLEQILGLARAAERVQAADARLWAVIRAEGAKSDPVR